MTKPDHHTPRAGGRAHRRPPNAALRALVTFLAVSPALLAGRARHARADESGNVITDNLGMIILGVAAIVAIMAGLQATGTKVITDITKTLGV